MSLLDDAQRLLEIGAPVYDTFCLGCQRQVEQSGDSPAQPHSEQCPTLALPQIVAALSVAEDMAGILLLLMDNQIRNGWVKEGSPLLDEARRALELYHAMVKVEKVAP